MIYMAGDNNLSADMAYSLAELSRIQNDDLNLLVYYDGATPNAPTLYCDFTETDEPIFIPSDLITNKKYTSTDRRNSNTQSDENSATTNSLLNFINWCVNDTNYDIAVSGKTFTKEHFGRRAKKYCLILSGHSSAFQNIKRPAVICIPACMAGRQQTRLGY